MRDDGRIVVIFGPTASGKTALAIELARELGGEVINADSRQVYAGAPLLMACPSAADYAAVPHHLFEFLPVSQRFSAGLWATVAREKIRDIQARGKVPLVVGGTGFYLRVLMEGIDDVPEIPADVEARFSARPVEELYARLGEVDPALAAKLKPADSQRIIRALSVHAHTGVPLSAWQQGKKNPGGMVFRKIALNPPREVVRERIAQRWEKNKQGILQEVRKLKEAGCSPDMPALKGLAIPELFAVLEGAMTLEQAGQVLVNRERQYAKRQYTWLRNSFGLQDYRVTGL